MLTTLIPAAVTWSEAFPVVDAFQERIRQTGVGSAQLALVAFGATFLIVRTITHLIRAGRGPFGNVSIGGTHLHHLVPGIFLLLISGMLGIAGPLPDGWQWVIPIMYGIGAALTLDEFALWLTLKDVYWEKEGRRSIDAVIVAGTLLALIALGLPFWADVIRNADVTGSWVITSVQVLAVLLALMCFLKGKWTFAALGIFVIPIGIIGAIRLARPHSRWARTRYGVRKMTAAEARYPRDRHTPMWPWKKPPVPDEKDLDGDGTPTA